jgi:hypothetical protein
MQVTTIGLDLAKHVFQIHGIMIISVFLGAHITPKGCPNTIVL